MYLKQESFIMQYVILFFRLLEEAIEKGTWLICTGIENRSECENILDFMIRRLKTSPNIHDNFRFWIICQDMKALTLSTAQKCCSHYLGHEVTYVVSYILKTIFYSQILMKKVICGLTLHIKISVQKKKNHFLLKESITST